MRLEFQLLPCAVEIVADDDRLLPTLRYLSNSAIQEIRPLRSFNYRVNGHGPYEIREEGDLLEPVSTPAEVLAILYRRCQQRAMHLLALGGWTVIHGGLARVGGRRLLLTGPTGVGKTTLMLRLLYDGHAVEGDEYALVRDDVVIAFPRPFHLKSGIGTVVPELRSVPGKLPSVGSHGDTISAFDPAEAGFRWHLELSRVDAAVCMVANHSGHSSVSELEPGELVYRLLSQTIWIDGASKSRLVSACSGLAKRRGYELMLGDLSEAGAQLTSISTSSDAGANGSTKRTEPVQTVARATAVTSRLRPSPSGLTLNPRAEGGRS